MLEKVLETPIATLLVVAGLVFILLSIATIKRPIVIDITSNGRKVSGLVGGLLLITGVTLNLDSNSTNPSVTPTQPPTSPHLEVLSLYTAFSKPEDRPPQSIPIAIPRHIITTGKSYSGLDHDLHVWIIVCPLLSQSCSIKELKLDTAGEWADTIDVGTLKDDCSSFDIYFVLASKEVSGLLNTFKQNSIRKDEYESFDYKDKDAFIVVRSLADNGNDVCSQATK